MSDSDHVHRHPSTEARDLALDPAADPRALAALVDSEWPFVREYLAANPSADAETLRALLPARIATEHDRDLVRALLGNPASPPDLVQIAAPMLMDTLDRFRLDRYLDAVTGVFGRSDVPTTTLLDLLESPTATRHFRCAAAEVAVDPDVLERLRADRSGRVRDAAARS